MSKKALGGRFLCPGTRAVWHPCQSQAMESHLPKGTNTDSVRAPRDPEDHLQQGHGALWQSLIYRSKQEPQFSTSGPRAKGLGAAKHGVPTHGPYVQGSSHYCLRESGQQGRSQARTTPKVTVREREWQIKGAASLPSLLWRWAPLLT